MAFNALNAKLTAELPGKVFTSEAAEYKESNKAYFTAFESALSPAVIVRPSNVADVSTIVTLAKDLKFPLAIKGAGHTPWAGVANVEGGVTMDMRHLQGIQLSADEKTVSVATGENWGALFKVLEAQGLATVGGRVSCVGVGGLTLGEINTRAGGASFFSGRYGFVCDAVRSFEVVLSSGKVVEASASSNPDLFTVLKGGSNNFGVVTRIVLPVFPQGPMWGGLSFFPGTSVLELLEALVSFASSPDPDEDAHVIVAYSWTASISIQAAATCLFHASPKDDKETPKSLEAFTIVAPKLQSSVRLDSPLAFADEQGGHVPDGERVLYFTTTVKPDLQLFTKIKDLYLEALAPIKEVQNLRFVLHFQPVTAKLLEKSGQAGPNAMGLSPDMGPFVYINVNPMWTEAEDDDKITAACEWLIQSIEALAAAEGKGVQWKFMNYCYKTQDPIASYGKESVAKMKEVSKKYDPAGFFQKQVPGGFKLQRD
ncbi:FAD-binding domain-containing protein [Lophiostoma macrostomum CBS 122681]|uniref:FAD-binding domain-containing protein n=1 Tax=Lophiostoma macrostomum CBS 122681 TaxID=1314788 RepID=A0A6A6TT25_9PLEO|nr:FAD-binding domain-containing protein [Lophiostoma macrostomum CBS 122681]